MEIIVAQYKRIEELEQEIERLKTSLNLDSQTSSKPPSTDLLKKSEKVKEVPEKDQQKPKRKPGGQPGHPGKTRKGFARVDRIEVLKPLECPNCGSKQWSGKTVRIDRQQVAQLVTRPIEIVEYQSHHCQCAQCAGIVAAKWPAEIIPGQDLGVRLQGLLSWLGNYAHMPYEKQQELLWELGEIGRCVERGRKTAQRV